VETYTCPLLHSAKACCLIASTVTPRIPEDKQMPLHTLSSSRITSRCLPIISLTPGERERKGAKKQKGKRIRDRTSLASLYSTHWGWLRRKFPRVNTPWVRLPRPPSTAPPRVGSTCAYPSLSALGVKLDCLHGSLGNEPYGVVLPKHLLVPN
jgi:hypothetical protein